MIELRAPAKLNLGLELLSRRDDGYHEIETVFLPLRLFDGLRMDLRDAPGIELSVRGAELPSGPENLAFRAAERTAGALGLRAGLRIELDKQIPIAAGLGGGSSDAATVILGVETLAKRRLEPRARQQLALALGADVPFFLDPLPALGQGVGERLTPLPDVPEMCWLLAVFPFPVSTAQAYREASGELTLPREGSSIAALLGPSGVSASPPNDLEAVCVRRHPEILEVRHALASVGAMITGMSGSGPTVFGRFADLAAASRASREIELPVGVRTMAVSSPGSTSDDWGWGVAKR